MSQKLTHSAIKKGCDARTPRDWRARVKVRETKLYWIDKFGHKYSKKWNGRGTGNWPMYRLDLDSIRPLPSEEAK